ncbi:MAG: amidohydrolase family protein [Dehalococcoidia bacterium]
METVDVIVHGGRVALSGGVTETAIAINGERIVAIGDPDALPGARTSIDATGKDILPGIIDAHSHIGFDDLTSLTRSSAYGGVTTTIPFIGGVGNAASIAEAIRRHRAEAEQGSVIDVAFHAYLFPQPDGDPMAMLAGIEDGVRLGVRSYKMFMAYRRNGRMSGDDFLFRAFRTLAGHGGLPMVHAENGDLIDAIEEQLLAEGKVGREFYHDSRPPEAESEAVARAASLAKIAGSSLYVVHLSTDLGLQIIGERQQAGQQLWTETCPQYLALSNDDLLKRGAYAKIAPPLRHRENVEAMWRGLRRGTIAVVASDHSPHDPALKAQGAGNIFYLPNGEAVPFGMPGAETLLPVLYSDGVAKRGLPLWWLGRVLSENPARIFGLYPRKGVIAPGSDADLTIIDPQARLTISAAMLHSRTGYSIYEGKELQGFPVLTLLRGQVVLNNGTLQQSPAYGRYLPAGTSLAPL